MASEMADVWREVRRQGRKKRASNRGSSLQMLRDAGIEPEVKNSGAHLIIRRDGTRWDFWPGTGKWVRDLDYGRAKRGVKNLIREVTDD